ncbi:MAG: hypothetical protein OXR66_03570 [Candidatus Woesearchaeota archaeon]|nr:hypothetical protein [Candidatus Woesearchaeota archaeon]
MDLYGCSFTLSRKDGEAPRTLTLYRGLFYDEEILTHTGTRAERPRFQLLGAVSARADIMRRGERVYGFDGDVEEPIWDGRCYTETSEKRRKHDRKTKVLRHYRPWRIQNPIDNTTVRDLAAEFHADFAEQYNNMSPGGIWVQSMEHSPFTATLQFYGMTHYDTLSAEAHKKISAHGPRVWL